MDKVYFCLFTNTATKETTGCLVNAEDDEDARGQASYCLPDTWEFVRATEVAEDLRRVGKVWVSLTA